jgi:hypothetical protein
MKKPANWNECVGMSRKSGVAPQIIAEAFHISPACLTHDKGLTPQFKDITESSLFFQEAVELGLHPQTLEILEQILDKHMHTVDDCKFVIEQALCLDYRNIALAAIAKMASMLP